MERGKSPNGLFKRMLRRLVKEGRGKIVAMFALGLPVLIGSGAIAVDVGYLMVARNTMQNASDGGARAGAVVLANGGTQAAATTAATNIANQNIASLPALAGATPVVTFPTATSIRVGINFNLRLFLAPVIGINTAAVSTTATAQIATVASVPPNSMAPLAIYCNNPAGCAGVLDAGQTRTVRRYCGNYFSAGPTGNGCGSNINNAEVFTVGITFDNNNSNNAFRTAVRDGYGNTVTIDQQARALPGNRNGWRDGMADRLDDGRNIMVLPVIREAIAPTGNYNIEVVDFMMVDISNFQITGNTDQTTFTVIQATIDTTNFASAGQGLGINSLSGVRLIE